MSRKTDYAEGKLFPLILRFSIPASISLLISAIYNIVDRIFIGNFSGNTALAALSICFPLSFMMIAFGLMCSAGGSTVFTLYRGRREDRTADRVFGNAFILTIFFEILLTAVLLLFPDFFLKLFGVTDTTYEPALEYYRIVALGCLFQGLSLLFCDFVRVSGKPVLGMCVTGAGAVTNIALDALFVAGLSWGVQGAAAATVIGQIVSAGFGAWMLFGGRTSVKIRKDTFRPDRSLGKELTSCGFAFWIAQMAMGFIALVYNGQLGKYGGDVAISAYAIVSSVMTFIIMPASGISQGIQPILGFNYGAENFERVKQTFVKATMLSVGVTAVIWAAAEIFPAALISLFGGGPDLMSIGIPALRFNFVIAPVLGFVMLATTFFQSIGKPNASSLITLIRQVIALVPFIYILPGIFGTIGIFYAQPVSDLIATVLSAVLIVKSFREMRPTGFQVEKCKA